jgi:hypothetical protein
MVTEFKLAPALLVCQQREAPGSMAIHLYQAGCPGFWPEPELLRIEAPKASYRLFLRIRAHSNFLMGAEKT